MAMDRRPSLSKLQRSSVSFRRQGSSGRIWDDPMRGLDLKGLSTTPKKAAALHHDAFILAGDPSPRVVSRSLARHGDWGAASASAADAIVESPEVAVASAASPRAASVVVMADDGSEREEKPARRGFSSAFCACMGHPPASHAQQ